MPSVMSSHYSIIEPYQNGDRSITNSTQPADALLGDINDLPRISVIRVVGVDGQVIETVELELNHGGIYEMTNERHSEPSGEYQALRS